jgi:hypothetical protein
MPSIELQRLNAEIEKITNQFDQIDLLHGNLVNLLERYADWAFRPGQTSYRNAQLPAYNTPALVMQRLMQAIKPRCQADPALSMQLIDRLRRGEYLEQRSLAIQILSILPVEDAPAFMQFVDAWITTEKEARVIEELFSVGCKAIREKAPLVWLEAIDSWLESADPHTRAAGMRALTASAEDAAFAYLPNLYQVSTSLLMTMPHGVQGLLDELLEAFIRRSPAETSFFLRQIMLRKPSPGTARLIRKKLGSIPPEYQPVLRALLFDTGKTADKAENNFSDE